MIIRESTQTGQVQTSDRIAKTKAKAKAKANAKAKDKTKIIIIMKSTTKTSHLNDRGPKIIGATKMLLKLSLVAINLMLLCAQTSYSSQSILQQQAQQPLNTATTQSTIAQLAQEQSSTSNHSSQPLKTSTPITSITTTTNVTSDISSISNINISDIRESSPPIEQVAKAEALVATATATQLTGSSSSSVSHSSPSSISGGSQSSSSISKRSMYDVCKTQTRTNLHLTNLSQIVFQPSDVCSTWLKMMRSMSSSHQDDSYPWSYIEQLNLSQNNLTVLHDSSGLNRLISLLDLKITHNQLTRCEESSLAGLQNLKTLDLSHNRLMGLPSRIFQPVKNTIKKLILSHNSISVLVPTLFESLNKLEHLDLSHNDITSHWFDDRLLMNLTQLRYLDLSFNKLTVFSSPMTFSSLQQLETLSLQHNELRQVPETIQYLRYLTSLDLSQNYIYDITNASYLSNCRQLFNLNLEANKLENITRDAFSDLPALKVLNLANNQIHHLDPQAFDCKYYL